MCFGHKEECCCLGLSADECWQVTPACFDMYFTWLKWQWLTQDSKTACVLETIRLTHSAVPERECPSDCVTVDGSQRSNELVSNFVQHFFVCLAFFDLRFYVSDFMFCGCCILTSDATWATAIGIFGIFCFLVSEHWFCSKYSRYHWKSKKI